MTTRWNPAHEGEMMGGKELLSSFGGEGRIGRIAGESMKEKKIKRTQGQSGSISKKVFCSYCRLLYDRHLVTGVGGNLSARSGRKFLLTPTGYSLRDVDPASVVVLDSAARVIRGGVPTKDVNMHLGILRSRADITVVCHIHGAALIALSAITEPGDSVLPPLTPGFVYYAYPMSMVPFVVPGTEELAAEAVRRFASMETSAVLLQNHGLVTVGRSFEEAFNVAEEVEEAARVYLETGSRAHVIPEDGVARIRQLRQKEQGE